MIKNNSKFVKHTSCDHCESSDGNALFDDGHQYCYACKTYVKGNGEDMPMPPPTGNPSGGSIMPLSHGAEIKAIPSRGISRSTCEKYGVTQDSERHYYPYSDATGKTVAMKVREVTTKGFKILGNFNDAQLFGQSLFHKGGKYVTICEGELDALAAFQMTGSQWPVVSIRNGAQAALKDCKANFEWLDSFDAVVVCFDSDEPGKVAADQVAELFAGKAKIVKHLTGYKDACDYLVADAGKAFVNEWWKAELWKPDGIVNGADLWDAVSSPEKPAEAMYPWEGLNKLLYGIRPAELITVTAGSGLGKSQFLREILFHVLNTTKWNIGGMFLEESTRKTARSIMSLSANKLLHLPDTEVTEQELKDSFDATLGTKRIYLFDHFGSTDIDNICNRIRYLAKACDCRLILLDHISIIISGANNDDERKAIDLLMTKLRTLVQELDITLICVSHLKRPNGNAGHEDGQAVSLSQLRGSGAIAQLSDAVITLERNSMSDDPETRNTTKVAVAKNRHTGFTGPACSLRYERESGRLSETTLEPL
tara:strand:+ start:1562 stop:3172 length:1611 start_codon:yes stop_codon:yes gene_type:complete